MSLFANSSDLYEGDLALILRADGTFQMASAIPEEQANLRSGRRLVQHMQLILGLYLIGTDDDRLVEVTALGSSRLATDIIRANMPVEH